MRMRKKKRREERIAARAGLHFGRGFGTPVFLEIGCGKGGFICELAKNTPGHNFVAVERNRDVVLLAMERADRLGLGNVRFLIAEAEKLADYFEPGQVAGIYLNFSDPWHKNAHAHRRLTHGRFLSVYKKIMMPGASLSMKTDNQGLFDFSVKSLAENGFEIISCTRDLYAGGCLCGNVQTEYEQKFVAEGAKIYRLEARILEEG